MNDETNLKESKQEQEAEKSPFLIPASIVAAGIIVALAVVYSGYDKKVKAPSDSAGKQTAEVIGSPEAKALLDAKPGDHVLGNPEAPVAFVEFGDFQCPFCGRFYKTSEKELIEKYVKSGKVKFIWRDFAFLGDESFDSARAARCAGEQGKFWQYHNYLFENQEGENEGAFSPASLKRFADELGLDAKKFNACLDSGKYLDDVKKETELGRELGVSGTPSSFINGRQITGSVPFAQFEAAIAEALDNRQ